MSSIAASTPTRPLSIPLLLRRSQSVRSLELVSLSEIETDRPDVQLHAFTRLADLPIPSSSFRMSST